MLTWKKFYIGQFKISWKQPKYMNASKIYTTTYAACMLYHQILYTATVYDSQISHKYCKEAGTSHKNVWKLNVSQ
jgi:hypothetical protein